MFKRKFSISVVIAFILILNPLTSFALILVHQTHSLSPKGSTSINVVANGARYRFIVGISLGGYSPNPDGGFVYSTDGYKYQQSSITWEYPEADGVFNVEGEESENNYLKSLQWQTPITNKSYQIKVKGKRWPYGPGGGGPYDPNWESTASGQITAPTIYDTALIKDSSKYKAGTEVSVDPSEVLVVEAKAADDSQDIKNSEVTIFWNLKDPSPANTGSGSLSSSSTTTDSTGLAKVDLTCSNANGDDHIVTAQDKSSEPSSSSDSGKAIVGFRVEITDVYGIGSTDKFIPLSSDSSKNKTTIKYKILPQDFQLDSVKIQVFKSDGTTKVYEETYTDVSYTKYTGTDLTIEWNGTDNQTSNNYADPEDDTHKIKLIGKKSDDTHETDSKNINVLPLPDSAYLVTRTSSNTPDDTNKVLSSGTSVDLYGVFKCKVDSSEYRYYLGNEGSSLPTQVTIGGSTVSCNEWLNSKWGDVSLTWKQVDPSSDHYTLNWSTENLLDWSGWSHSASFGEGSRWFRIYFTFQGYEKSSGGGSSSRRVSLKGSDANSDSALTASYIYVPYVWGEETYENGVDCSGLCCSVKNIARTTADGLHDSYLRDGSDNDVNEDNVPDHPEPWEEGINKSTAGDMWYVDDDEDALVDHVGIFTGSYVIHASWSAIEVVRNSNPRNNSWWNGESDSTIYRGVGTN